MLQETLDTGQDRLGLFRRLLASESYLLADHLLRLHEDGRQRRFGHNVSDAFIARYAARAGNFGNVTFGYFVDGELRAVAELRPDALIKNASAEVAFSVEQPFANRGIATHLMGMVIRTARNRGLKHLILVCVPDNAKMQAVARHYGADLKIEDDSIVADIIPGRADYQSWFSEILDDRMAYIQSAFDLGARVKGQ